MTDYVATRWYRSPEVLLGSPDYGKPADLWAFACVIVELYIGKPAFAGQSTLNQIARVIEVTGLPDEMDLAKLSSPLTFGMFQTLDVPANHKTIEKLVNSDEKNLIDLLKRIFIFSPDRRITIEQVLRQPYFDEHHDDKLEYRNIKRMSTDAQYNTLVEIRQSMYELINKVNKAHKESRPINTYYERYTNYN